MLSREQVEFLQQQLEPMLIRNRKKMQTRLKPLEAEQGSQLAESLDLLVRRKLVYRWQSALPGHWCYLPNYAGCIFAGLSCRATTAAWRDWLCRHPRHAVGFGAGFGAPVLRDRPPLKPFLSESDKAMLLDFLVNLCYYSQNAPQLGIEAELEAEDAEYWLSLVSYQVACFLANYTVEGSGGVESDVILADLVERRRSERWWRARMRRLVTSYGGWKTPGLGSLNPR